LVLCSSCYILIIYLPQLYSRCLLYAYDVKLHKDINNEKDVMKLQEDINMVYNWAQIMIFDFILKTVIS
jgi:hypothetical protein